MTRELEAKFLRAVRARDVKGLRDLAKERHEGAINRMAMVASAHGWVAGLRLALGLGADPNEPDPISLRPPTEEAVGHPEALKVLLEAGAHATVGNPLICAVQEGVADSVRLLVEAGADVNQHVEGFPTPLDFARLRGFSEIALYLVEHGARPKLT